MGSKGRAVDVYVMLEDGRGGGQADRKGWHSDRQFKIRVVVGRG